MAAQAIATARRFYKDRRGNVAVIFALAAIPLVVGAGAAIDLSRALIVRQRLGQALDAAGLAVGRTLNITPQKMHDLANDFFKANYPLKALGTPGDVSVVPVTADTFQLKVTADVPTTIMRIVGIDHLTIAASNEVTRATTRLRVALVLDTTGSMASAGKIDALKTATKKLLKQLKDTVTNTGDVYVSIIPFSRDMNVGSSNFNATWIDWTAWDDEPPFIKTNKPSNWDQIKAGSACPFTNNTHGFVCTLNPTNGSTATATIPSTGTYSGYICPSIDNGGKITAQGSIYYNGCYQSVTKTKTIASGSGASCGSTTNCACSGSGKNKVCTQTYYDHPWVKNAHNTWNGCVTDRGDAAAPNAGNYDQKVSAPLVGTTATMYAAQQYSLCSPQVSALSDNWTAMNTLVDSFYPDGSTNQPIGLVWGWLSLAGNTPLVAPAMDANFQYAQFVILMSDGLNTQDRWYGNGSATSTQVDSRMYNNGPGTCKNVKDAGIIIYAIQVNTGGDPTSQLLKNCATDQDRFYELKNANDLITTFEQIGTEMTQLRLSK